MRASKAIVCQLYIVSGKLFWSLFRPKTVIMKISEIGKGEEKGKKKTGGEKRGGETREGEARGGGILSAHRHLEGR